jgi:ADP-ribose pyrophosphatase YjhB (NUDIX family)
MWEVMDNANKPKVVTRAIILVNGKVLLGKRARGRGANQFALVGGKPEGNETPEEAITREVNEELGILFKNIKPWKEEIDKKSVPGESWNVYYFYGEGEGGLNLKKDEISDVAFVDMKNISKFDIAFDHRDILSEFFDTLK